MKNPELFDFIRTHRQSKFVRSAWVHEFGFEGMYVRVGRKWLDNEGWVVCLTIANIKANIPGEGSFTRLIEAIQLNFPNLWIYIENVMNGAFAKKLERLGFDYVIMTSPPCFILEPLGAKTKAIQNLIY